MPLRTGLILGSKPTKYGAIELDHYVKPEAPAIPATLDVPRYPWGMLANDEWGDCVIAAMYHGDEAFYLRQGRRPWPYATKGAIALYSAITGFDPNAGPPGANPTDQGTDPSQAMHWWVTNGLWPIPGHRGRHALDGFGVLPGNSPNIRRAIWEFGGVMLALGLPSDWQTQVGSDNAPHWTGADHGPQQDGHAVWAVGYTPDLLRFVTWGTKGDADNAWLGAYLEQVLVPLSHEVLNSAGVGPAGFDFAQMRQDLPSPQ